MVDESAAVVSAESKIIDADAYELKDVIDTVTKLAGIGITGAAHIGRIAFEEKPPDTVLAMGEYIASVVRRMVTQTGTVMQDAAIHMEKGKNKYSSKKWLESMTRLIDIGIAGGMEIVETVAAGPARFEVHPVRSDEFAAPPSRTGEPRTLKVDNIKREGTEAAIAEHKISFDPPVLEPGVTKFVVLVDASDLVSGVYKGTVKAEYPKKEPPEPPDVVDVSISL
ncbi:hypothetical protein [Mycolicibacterium agri]|nr:hypothetical protein [Mycolicibacterium agri]